MVNCTSSQWLVLPSCLPSSSHSAANDSIYIKKITDTWYLSWQMANDSSIFLKSNSVSVMKSTCSSMYTTVSPTATSQNVLVSMYAESLLVLHDSFGYFAHVQILATKIYVGLKISWRQPSTKIESLENLSHEIFFPWKFPCLRTLILLNNK